LHVLFQEDERQIHQTQRNSLPAVEQKRSCLTENVEGTLNVASSEEFDVKEILCEFECVETKKTTSMQYDAAIKRAIPK
jgi:hypothetical protein